MNELWSEANQVMRYVNAGVSAVMFIYFLKITVFHMVTKVKWMKLMFRALTMVQFLGFYISVAGIVNDAPATGTAFVFAVTEYFIFTLAKDALRFRESMKGLNLDL
jgi:hypothetical protein